MERETIEPVDHDPPRAWTTVVAQAEKTSARAICTSLIVDDKDRWEGGQLVYLEAFAPAQEARAFAQILQRSFSLSVATTDGSACATRRGLRLDDGGLVRANALKQGYRWIIAVPSRRYIVADSEEACFAVYADLLDQEHLVLRDWYRSLFEALPRLAAQIGTKACVRADLPVEDEVTAGLRDGRLVFPEPKLVLRLPKETEEERGPKTFVA